MASKGKEELLTYAELPEDDVQNVLDIHPPESRPSECAAMRNSSAASSSPCPTTCDAAL